jgi:hypothetical protein
MPARSPVFSLHLTVRLFSDMLVWKVLLLEKVLTFSHSLSPSPGTVSASQLPMDGRSAFSCFFQQCYHLDCLPLPSSYYSELSALFCVISYVLFLQMLE